MRTFIIALAFSIIGTSAYAACNSQGNCYNGGYNYNPRTGSTWSSRSNSYGSSGVDSRGNSWSYNRGTGHYYNYGTGERRTRGRRW